MYTSCLCLRHGSIKLLLLYIEPIEKWYRCLRPFFRDFLEELSRENEMELFIMRILFKL